MKTLIKYFVGILLVILLGVVGSLMGCKTTKIDKEIHTEVNKVDSTNITKVDSSNTTTITEEVDTFAVIKADTTKGSIPLTFFTDTTDTADLVFENSEVVLKIKKRKGRVDYEVIKKEQVIPFKFTRKTVSHTRLKRYSNTNVKKYSKTVDKSLKKTVLSLPWWIYLIIIVAILIGLYLLLRYLARRFGWRIPGIPI